MPLGSRTRLVQLGDVACSVWVASHELPIHLPHPNSIPPPPVFLRGGQYETVILTKDGVTRPPSSADRNPLSLEDADDSSRSTKDRARTAQARSLHLDWLCWIRASDRRRWDGVEAQGRSTECDVLYSVCKNNMLSYPSADPPET
jgi:hypothetical protein